MRGDQSIGRSMNTQGAFCGGWHDRLPDTWMMETSGTRVGTKKAVGTPQRRSREPTTQGLGTKATVQKKEDLT